MRPWAKKTRIIVTTTTRARPETRVPNQVERLSLPTTTLKAARTATHVTLQ